MERKYDRITKKHKFYKDGEHEKYRGHTFIYLMDYIVDGNIKTDTIVITEKDIFMSAINRAKYFLNLHNA